MAKARKQFGIMDAINSVTEAMVLEAKPDQTAEEKQKVYEAAKKAKTVIDNSNFGHLAMNADEAIEAQIVAEEEAEARAMAENAEEEQND